MGSPLVKFHDNGDGSFSPVVFSGYGSLPAPMSIQTSPTYGDGLSLGNSPGSFTGPGTGTPADIYAPLTVYQRYGDTTGVSNAPVTKTTQAAFMAASYYGPTADDSMECLSAYALAKATNSAYTQTRAITGFEGAAQIEGANIASGNFIGTAGRLRVLNTSQVTTAYGVYSTFDRDAGAAITNYYAFRQAKAGEATNNWTLYGQDTIQSEKQLRVWSPTDATMDFRVNQGGTGGSPSAFVYIRAPNGVDYQSLRIDCPASQIQAAVGIFDSGGIQQAFISRGGGMFSSVGFVVQNSSGTVFWRAQQAGPKWESATLAQTTVGAAGGASALPATPTKYLKVQDSAGTTLVIPAYAAS